MLMMGLCFVACSDDDGPSYSQSTVTNTELKDILVAKGYQFNEQGNLLLDDKANQTTSLDLSGTNISVDALSELSILPNLTDVNLSNNGYTKSFDFSKLPAQITGVDLTGNEIYEFDNLVKVEVAENGDEAVTNLHNITKLYLPYEAKDNISQIMRFYRQNKTDIENGTIDVKMVNGDGTLEKYTTLREIPDATLRNYLKENFSDLFVGDKVDISSYLNYPQNIADIYIANLDISNLEGIQYIIQNPYWKGTKVSISLVTQASCPSIKILSNLDGLTLYNVSIQNGINTDEATQLKMVYFVNVDGFKDLDLSTSNVMGQRELAIEADPTTGSGIILIDCDDVENVTLPTSNSLRFSSVVIECLPKLSNFDMSKFVAISALSIGDLCTSYELKMPNLVEFEPITEKTVFSVSQNSYNNYKNEIDAFVDKYYKSSDPQRLSFSRTMYGENNEGRRGYNWRN